MTMLFRFLILFLITIELGLSSQLCSVFQPFKVTPENAKFQIGGPFPLHAEDCVHVRPDVVQELIGVQWALSHWNRSPQNSNSKLAMAAGDTCSRESEVLSQTVTLLSEAGFFMPGDCYPSENPRYRTPLGLIMPTISKQHLNSFKDVLSSLQLPIITYSATTAQILFDAQLANVFSTVPRLDHYVQLTARILSQLEANRITLVYSDEYIPKNSLAKQIAAFKQSGIIVTEILSLGEAMNTNLASKELSSIIVVISSKDDLVNFALSPKTSALVLQKLYIAIPANGEIWSEPEIAEFVLYKTSPAQFLILQPSTIFETDQFRAYFLDILLNNYQSYPLLGTYMQQLYNCTLIGQPGLADCGLIDPIDLLEGYVYNKLVESAVLAAYSFGALAKATALDPEEPCSKPGIACARAATSFLKNRFTYTFGDSDPQAYRGFNLYFGEDRTLKSLKIEGLYVRRDPEFHVDTLLNFTLNGDLIFHHDLIKWADNTPVVSWCQPWRSECQKRSCLFFESENIWLQKPGHLYLMGLFDIRQYDTNARRCGTAVNDPRTVAMPAAFAYVLETIREKYPEFNLLPEVELGGIVIDACHDPVAAVESIVASSRDKCLVAAETMERNSTIASSNVAAFASGQRSTEFDAVRFLFDDQGGIQKPLIAATGLSKLSAASSTSEANFMPDYALQARATLDFLIRHGWDYVSVVLSDDDADCVQAYEAFQRLVESDDRVCISDVIHIRRNERIESVKNAMNPATLIVVSFTTAHDTVVYLKSQIAYNVRQRPLYIFVGEAHDWELEDTKTSGGLVSKLSASAWGSISIQPRRKANQDFRTFLSTINPKRFPELWFVKFWEDYFQCDVKGEKIAKHKRLCTGEERLPTEAFGSMTREAYFMLGLETIIFALDGLYKQSCPDQKGLCEAFYQKAYHSKLAGLISRMPKIDQQYVVRNYRQRVNGEKGSAYVEIGNWSNTDGLKFGGSLIWYDISGKSNVSLPTSTCRPPLCRCKVDSDFFKRPIDTAIAEDDDQNVESNRLSSKLTKPTIPKTSKTNFDYSTFSIRRHQWKKHPWTYIFLVLNSLLLLGAVFVLGLVCLKLCYKVVKGNQSLGICLLCGIILLYISVYSFIFDACELVCRMRYITHSTAYSICFGAMIAKAVQLRNSETLGFNGYVSFWNYWLLLFFIITVQLALNAQWAIIREPVLVSFLVEGDASLSSIILSCNWSGEEFLAAQIYAVILLSMALFLSLMNRNVKRNFKETRWLMCTCLICAPIWILWMVAYVVAPDPFKEIVVIMESITCATVILCFMYGPKLYILLSYEPILVEYPPGFKLKLGNGSEGSSLEKNDIVDSSFPNANECGLNFEDDDINEDGQRSVVSSNGSTKSTSLAHSSSSASTITTRSNDSSTPVYNAIRKKSRSKRLKTHPSIDSSTISAEVAQMRDDVFGETVSSAH